jgi:prophage regulatory protein
MKLLKLPQVIELTGISRSAIYYLRKRNEFPNPIHLSERIIAWDEETINSWLKEKKDKL